MNQGPSSDFRLGATVRWLHLQLQRLPLTDLLLQQQQQDILANFDYFDLTLELPTLRSC
jgi:hypothetical protein